MGARTRRTTTRTVVGVVSGSHFVNHMYLILLPPIFDLLLVEFDTTLAALGLAVGIMSVAGAAFQLPFGYVSDNYSRTLALGIGLSLGAAGVLTLASAPSYEWVLVSQALLGMGIAAHHPAHYPLLSAASSEARRARAFSVHDFAGHIGYGAAPLVIVGVLSLRGTTWRDALLLIGAVGALYAVVTTLVLWRAVPASITRAASTDTADREGQPILTRVSAALRSLTTSRAILALAVLSMVMSMVGWGFRAFAVVLLTNVYAFNLSLANAVLTVMFIASGVGTLASGELTDRLSPQVIIFGAYAVVVVAALAIGTTIIPPLLAAAMIVIGASAGSMGGIPKNRIVDKLSTTSALGVNFAIITVGVTVGGSVAPPLFGAVIDAAGFGLTFYLIAAIGVLAVLIVAGIFVQYREDLEAGAAASADD